MPSLFNTFPNTQYAVPADAKALLVLIHGLAEHSARYGATIEFLNARGIGCVAFDLRGHGKAVQSERERGDVESFSDFVTDAVAVIEAARAKYPQLRLFVWGHSMGALVATLATARVVGQGPGKIRGVITSSAPIAAFDAYLKMLVRLLTWIARVLPTFRVPRPFQPGQLSRNLEVGLRYSQDPLVPKDITLRFLTGLAEACDRSLRVASKLSVAWLALHGTDDEISPPIGSQRLIDALASTDKQLRLWPGARHEVHNEIEPTRTEFLECMVEWVRERT